MDSSFVSSEIASQPDCWRRLPAFLPEVAEALPQRGERVAVIGCGTSWFMAMAYAALREERGHGITDAWTPGELPLTRAYDRYVALSRSGTTTEVLEVLARLAGRAPRVAITALPARMAPVADHVIPLEFADERSVVQTRFATTALGLLRASLGDDMEAAAIDAEAALEMDLGALVDADQLTFLGTGWTIGIAHEAALKLREAAQVWTEAYPALQYRHGPMSIAEAGRVVWVFGTATDRAGGGGRGDGRDLRRQRCPRPDGPSAGGAAIGGRARPPPRRGSGQAAPPDALGDPVGATRARASRPMTLRVSMGRPGIDGQMSTSPCASSPTTARRPASRPSVRSRAETAAPRWLWPSTEVRTLLPSSLAMRSAMRTAGPTPSDITTSA